MRVVELRKSNFEDLQSQFHNHSSATFLVCNSKINLVVRNIAEVRTKIVDAHLCSICIWILEHPARDPDPGKYGSFQFRIRNTGQHNHLSIFSQAPSFNLQSIIQSITVHINFLLLKKSPVWCIPMQCMNKLRSGAWSHCTHPFHAWQCHACPHSAHPCNALYVLLLS
jgi:hypothetical protein